MARGGLVVAVALLLGTTHVSPAQATFIEYFGANNAPGGTLSGAPLTQHNAFVTALGGVAVDDLEDTTGLGSAADPYALSFPGATVTATLSTSANTELRTSATGGLFPTSGSNYIYVQNAFTITFSVPVSAFGFYVTDAGDGGADLTITLANGGPVVRSLDTSIYGNGSLLFWGFTDDMNAYSSIEIAYSSNDGIGYDDFTVANAALEVPEPTSFSLLAFGVGGLMLAERRRRRRARAGA
jgi:hypothetical protein